MTEEVNGVNQTPTWEKIVGTLGIVLLAIGVIYLALSALHEKDKPPAFAFQVIDVNQSGEQFLVQVNVTNQGHRTVAALQVEGTLALLNGKTEKSSAHIDYVPSQSTRTIGLLFEHNPRQGNLTLKASGYQLP